MKERLVLFVLVFLSGLTGCGLITAPDLLLDSFEGEISPNTLDYGSSDNSQLTASASSEKRLCGEQSLNLSYDLQPGGYMWAGRGWGLDVEGASCWLVEPGQIEWEKYKAISVAVYGQSSGAMYAFDIRDKGGEIWRYLIDDDFQGWQEIVLPFKGFFARTDWQPDDAETTKTLDFPVKSYQFEPLLPGQRQVYFDCIKLTARSK